MAVTGLAHRRHELIRKVDRLFELVSGYLEPSDVVVMTHPKTAKP